MKKQMLLFILSLSLTGMLLSSCDKTQSTDPADPKTANEKTVQAYTEMENLFAVSGSIENKNFSNVEKLYKEAVVADPTNPTANFGAAFAHILATFADTSIKNTMKRWEGVSIGGQSSMLKFGIPAGTSDMTVPTEMLGKNLVKMMQVATSDPPTITEMQNLIRDKILPRINYAIERLAVVEQNPNFELRISGKMQGNAGKKDVYLDLTEVYVMDAMLQGMKASVEQFLVFQFQLSGYNVKAAVAALQQNNTTFFVLASDGATRAQSVKSSLVTAVSKIRSGVTFLKNETDNQDDDIIKIGSGGITVNLDTVLTYLNKIESALTGTFSVEIKNADSDNNTYMVQISLSNFFSNLPQNPKQAWLPTYTVDTTSHGDLLWRWQAQDYASFTFPDPTFGGLFPGMTNDKLKRIMYIDEAFAWRLSIDMYNANSNLDNSTVNIVVNGKTYFPKPDNYYWLGSSYRYFDFYVMDNNNMPVQQINATINGQQMSLLFYKKTPVVRAKEYDYVSADVTTASQTISVQTSSNYVTLNLQNWSYYKIERAIGTGSFSARDSIQTSYYYDYNVLSKTTYRYRALRIGNYYEWSNGYFAYRPNNYTNTVSITTP